MWTTHLLTTLAIIVAASVISVSARPGRQLVSDENTLSTIIPGNIAVPVGNKLHLALYAVGHQHYTFNGSSWVLQNATAKLYAMPKGDLIAKHFFLHEKDAKGGQPSWESYHPESLVTAKSIAAVTVDANSITWNLLQTTSESGSKESLGSATYVQRLQTQGGLPPSSSAGAKTGDTHSTPYSATYAYYVKND